MQAERFRNIDLFLQEMVNENYIPGAVYGVLNSEGMIAENAIGLAHIEENLPMQLETLFDLASLTKICATTMAIFSLIQEGKLDIEDRLIRFFPNIKSNHLTVFHLLTHTSGYPATREFYKYGWSKQEIINNILQEDTKPNSQVTYSDLNFILLGHLVEVISKESLDQYTARTIYQPLGMTHTGFNPQIDKKRIAPTEWLTTEGRYQWGKVHDENAFYLNGVSGHAGLFSNLVDLKRFVSMLLKDGVNEHGRRLFSKALLQASRRNETSHLNGYRGLGWQLADDPLSSAGKLLSRNSYGHTGFTGTSIWIDPDRKIGFILLTNRVYISREIDTNRIRRIFHNLAVMALDD